MPRTDRASGIMDNYKGCSTRRPGHVRGWGTRTKIRRRWGTRGYIRKVPTPEGSQLPRNFGAGVPMFARDALTLVVHRRRDRARVSE